MRNILDRFTDNVHLAVTPLRAVLVVMFLVLIVFQVMSLPGQFRYMAEQSPELAHLRWPLTAVTVLMVVCVQVVIVAIWRLLTMVRDDRIFSERSLRWVDVIVAAIVAGWLLLFGVFLFYAGTGGDPGTGMLFALMLLSGAVLALLMVVMRALLSRAITLRTDMEAVI